MKHARWGLAGLMLAVALAQTPPGYNYFPVPGITYTASGGMALGSASGGAQGLGTLNAQGLYVNGVAVTTGGGTVTGVTGVTANGFTWSIANPTSTPALTLSTTFTGIGYSNGTGFAAAIASEFPTLNQNTTGNAATATLAATASALAATPSLCASGMVAQGILANGDATGCLTPFSVVNESANTFFAGPPSGTAALPSFRAMVEADLPLSASIFWTGNTTITPTSGVALTLNGAASADALDVTNGASGYTKIIGATTTGESNGLEVIAGTNSGDTALSVMNRAQTNTLFSIGGDGTMSIAGPLTISGTANLNSETNFGSSGSVTMAGTNTLSGSTSASGSFTLSGTTTASPGQAANGIGYQGTPTNAQDSNYTVAASDNGKSIEFQGSSGETLTVPCNILPQGFVVTVISSYGGVAVTITSSSGSLYWANGSSNVTGNRTLTGQGIATIYISSFLAGCLITGSGLS